MEGKLFLSALNVGMLTTSTQRLVRHSAASSLSGRCRSIARIKGCVQGEH